MTSGQVEHKAIPQSLLSHVTHSNVSNPIQMLQKMTWIFLRHPFQSSEEALSHHLDLPHFGGSFIECFDEVQTRHWSKKQYLCLGDFNTIILNALQALCL